MDGGFGRWKDEGRPWRHPASLSPEQQNRYKQHLLLPEVGVEGQQKLLDAKSSCSELADGFTSRSLSGGSRCRNDRHR